MVLVVSFLLSRDCHATCKCRKSLFLNLGDISVTKPGVKWLIWGGGGMNQSLSFGHVVLSECNVCGGIKYGWKNLVFENYLFRINKSIAAVAVGCENQHPEVCVLNTYS